MLRAKELQKLAGLDALILSSENANVGGTSGLRGDLDNDGDVDIADFLVFVENFGKTTGG